MRVLRGYGEPEPGAEAASLAGKITALIVDSAVTYQAAVDALDLAAEQLAQNTVPSINPRRSD